MGDNEINSERKCWGRTKLFLRCQKSVSTGFFCSVHKTQPYIYLFRTVVGLVAFLAGAIYLFGLFCGHSAEFLKPRSEVYLDVDLACHSWKNDYINMVPGGFAQHDAEYSHVWEMLISVEPPNYSEETWRYYQPLFDESIIYVRDELDRLLASYPIILPDELRSLMENTKTQIMNQRSGYLWLQGMQRPADDRNVFFKVRFQSMIRALTKLSREADRLREEID